MDVELGDVQADGVQHFTGQSPSGYRHKLYCEMFCSFRTVILKGNTIFDLLVPNMEPPFPVQPLTEVQLIGSICSTEEVLIYNMYDCMTMDNNFLTILKMVDELPDK